MMQNPKKQQVKQYFDKVSTTYRDRFSEKKSFHQHFFQRRLELAIQGLNLTGKTVLDIGAGTGSLFDFLQSKNVDCEYYATDISAKMLAQSRIPKPQQSVGEVANITFPVEKFDHIFLLGVVSYMDFSELKNTIEWCQQHLTENGQLSISFSNKKSLDYRIRTLLHPILKLTGKGLIGQSFHTSGHTVPAVKNLLKTPFAISKITYFNFTCTPFNQLFPKFSVQSANWISNKAFSDRIQERLAADFIIRIAR